MSRGAASHRRKGFCRPIARPISAPRGARTSLTTARHLTVDEGAP